MVNGDPEDLVEPRADLCDSDRPRSSALSAGDIRRRPVLCAMRRRPAGTAAVSGRPATPRTIGVQRLAAPLTGTRADGFRAKLTALIGRPEQLSRAVRRPASGR